MFFPAPKASQGQSARSPVITHPDGIPQIAGHPQTKECTGSILVRVLFLAHQYVPLNNSNNEFHENCHSVAFYFMKEDSK